MYHKPLRINFVGNFASGYVGEVADETHLVRELEALGHKVRKVPRDIWKALADGEWDNGWSMKTPLRADINIICKWHHFNDEKYVNKLRLQTTAPVFYWIWDFMDYNEGGFHHTMAAAADLLLTNDGHNRIPDKEIKHHYFPFDVCDGSISTFNSTKRHDVVFFGSKLDQGDRVEWLTELNKSYPVKIFAWNHEEWKKLGFDAEPAVYGEAFNDAVAQSKIIMGFNVNDHTAGYWSNRVGKVLVAGGFLLQRYVPGMELFLKDGAEFFSNKQEMIFKVAHYLQKDEQREEIAKKGFEIGQSHFTSKKRVRELDIVINRYLMGGI